MAKQKPKRAAKKKATKSAKKKSSPRTKKKSPVQSSAPETTTHVCKDGAELKKCFTEIFSALDDKTSVNIECFTDADGKHHVSSTINNPDTLKDRKKPKPVQEPEPGGEEIPEGGFDDTVTDDDDDDEN